MKQTYSCQDKLPRSVLGNRRARAVDNLELEDKVAMTWNLFDAKSFDLLLGELTKHLIGPKVPNLHELVSTNGDTNICRLELKLVPSVFTPVYNHSNLIAT